jgi:catechol-2,3-dioxygenase
MPRSAINIAAASHGNAWSVYLNDPEGNYLEFFVDTDWHVQQPFYIPLELDKKTDGEIAGRRTAEAFDAEHSLRIPRHLQHNRSQQARFEQRVFWMERITGDAGEPLVLRQPAVADQAVDP